LVEADAGAVRLRQIELAGPAVPPSSASATPWESRSAAQPRASPRVGRCPPTHNAAPAVNAMASASGSARPPSVATTRAASWVGPADVSAAREASPPCGGGTAISTYRVRCVGGAVARWNWNSKYCKSYGDNSHCPSQAANLLHLQLTPFGTECFRFCHDSPTDALNTPCPSLH
jgi:hypothetical protein